MQNYLHDFEHTTKTASISVSTNAEVIEAVKKRDTKEIIRILTPTHDLYHIHFYVITDTAGIVLARTHKTDIFGDSALMQQNIKDALKGKISTYYEEGACVKVAVRTGAPIYDTDGTLIGAVSAGVRFDTSEMVDNFKKHFDADFTVFFGNTRIATTIINKGKRIIDTQLDSKIAETIFESKEAYIGNVEVLGENYAAYYLPLINSHDEVFAVLVAGHSNAHLIAEKTRMITSGILIGILGLIVSIIVLLLIISKTIKPIKKLTHLVSEISGGNINVDIDRSLPVTDEVGKLTFDIYSLISVIKSLASDLSQFTREINIHGEIDFQVDTSRYCGVYKEIIGGIKALGDSISLMNKVMTAMDSLDSMIIVIDLDYNIIYMNRSLMNTFGLDIETCKGKKCHKVLRDFDQPCSMCLLPEMLPEKDKFPSKDYDFLYDEVYNLWLGGRAAIIRWVDGSMVYYQSLNNDTEKKRAQEQLNDALALANAASIAKSAFLANMSHELRTPLNVVVGLADLQLENDDLPEGIRENLHKISNAGNTLRNIVNDILDISKIESGKFALVPVEYHMASLLNDTAILIISRIDEKPIIFRLNITEDLPSKLYGDDLRIKQILNNLLGNAIKYTHKGSIELSINCVRESDSDSDVWMEISVKDTGIGIRSEDLKKIFSDYSQVDTNANRKIEGTGLGLAITKKLVESMDGVISVESEYGKGSTFRAQIRQGFVNDTPIGPMVVKNLCHFRYSENKRHFASNLVRADLSHARVLIVDDLRTNLEVSAGLTGKYKMQVDCVTSGQAAIERIKIGEPVYSAVFMDHMMPEMDGIEATNRIRALGTTYAQTIPVIALTANAVVGTEELFYENGFQAFITKPIDIMRLDSIVHQWIKNNPSNNPIGKSSEDLKIPDISAPNSFQEEQILEIIIPGVNAKAGLSACDGDQKIYLSVLRSYVADTSAVLKTIRDVTEEALPSYITAVHGIKGSSATVGAEAIREAAADLEAMARRGDLSEILARNDAFLKETESLVTAIKGWLEKRTERTVKPRLPAPDRALLIRLRQCCDECDLDGAEKAMDELDNADYEKDADLVAQLREKLDAFDFFEIAEQLVEYE
jgi:signal transduction histidine kinase/FixJ family two-component response regulator